MGNKPSQTIKNKLDQVHDQLDPATAEKLQAARRQALDQLNKPSRFSLKLALPMGGLATAASLAVLVGVYTLNNKPEDITLPFGDNDMLVLTEDLSLIEDLAFYDWVLANEIPASES